TVARPRAVPRPVGVALPYTLLDLERRSRPLVGILREQALQELLDVRRDRTTETHRRRLWLRVEMVAADLDGVSPGEDVRASDEKIADCSQGVEIAARVQGGRRPDRLRRHVERS